MVAPIIFILGVAYCFVGMGLTGYFATEVSIQNDGVFSDYPWLFHLFSSIVVEIVTAIVPAMIIIRLDHKHGTALATAGAAVAIPLTIYYLYFDIGVTNDLPEDVFTSAIILSTVSTLIFVGVLPFVIVCLKTMISLTSQGRGQQKPPAA